MCVAVMTKEPYESQMPFSAPATPRRGCALRPTICAVGSACIKSRVGLSEEMTEEAIVVLHFTVSQRRRVHSIGASHKTQHPGSRVIPGPRLRS